MSVNFCRSRSRASGKSSYALRSSLKCDSCSARRLDGVNTTCAVCHMSACRCALRKHGVRLVGRTESGHR